MSDRVAVEDSFRVLFDESPHPIVLIAPEGGILAVNEAVVRLFGYTREEILADPTRIFMAPEYAQAGIEHFQRAAAGERQTFTSVILRRDGGEVPVLVTNTPLIVNGQVRAVYAQVDDQTDQRRAEAEREQALRRLEAIVGASGDAIMGRDAEEIITAWNPAAEALYGWTAEEVLGRKAPMIPRDRAEEADDLWRRVALGERVDQYETVRVRKDGRRIDVSLTAAPLRDEAGRVTGGVVVARDVTERRRALEALRASEAQFRALIEQAADAIVVAAPTGRLAIVNQAACALFGYAEHECLTLEITDLLDPEELRQSPFDLDAATPGRLVTAERTFRRKDGATFPAALRVRGLSDGRVQAVITDLTEQRRAEAERVDLERRTAEAEKLRALGQLAGGVAHDLAQNLALIAGYAEQALSALRGEPPNSSAAFDALAIVQHAALDGGETLKRLLGFAHGRGPEEHEPVNLVDIAEDVRRLTAPRWRDQAQEEGRPIAFEVDAHGAAVIQGAAAELREAVTNLVFNAIDAMPDGGRIRVTVERLGARVDVAVVDTGAGMSPEVVGRAFEPFYSTKGVHGTGLGLSQVYGVVQRHSGVVTIESEVGRGTTVRMTFPAGDGAPSSVAPESGSAPSQSLRVLVVDDEPRLAELATVLLRQDGHRVAAVTSAEEALALLAVEHFDALVSDVSLGDGMNGWALVRRVKQSSPTIRVVLVTGWGAAIADADARARGVDAVVPKPYRGEHLRRALSG